MDQSFSRSHESFNDITAPGLGFDAARGKLNPVTRIAVLAGSTVVGWSLLYVCWQAASAVIG